MVYNKYGEYYDLIYSAKNYDGECKGLIRIVDGSFNLETNVLTLKVKCKVIKNRKIIDSFQEEHRIRTFTPQEIAHFLNEIPYTLQK